jgi:hypothetical protein
VADDARAAEIKKWQDSLFAAFSHEGILGSKYLRPVMDLEPRIGAAFVDKYYGHRVLTDSFMDFFGETIWKQIEFNNKNGWPQDRPYYVTCLLMFLTMFRSFRAGELLALQGGYPLQGYIIQRSLKDQAFALCAAANKMESFGRLFGWDGSRSDPFSKEKYSEAIKNRMKVEDKIVRHIIGKDSGLSKDTQEELLRWNRLFNWEAHRGLLTLFRISGQVLKEKKLDLVLGPAPDELNESMYMNRCTELGWMILRLLPYMRRSETPKDTVWENRWRLLDGSFKMMVEGLGGLGKKIAPATIELVNAKFLFGPQTYYSESN